LQSLVVPQSSNEGAEDVEEMNAASSVGSKKNHRRFGKNATKFLGSSSNYENNNIKTLEDDTNDFDDLRVHTPPAIVVQGKSGMSPDVVHGNLPTSIQFGNNKMEHDRKASSASKDSKKTLILSNHHSKKNSR
jgi:hypothetical protein